MLSPTETTKKWLEDFVIGLNLCPFAAAPFRKNEIKFIEILNTDPGEISTVVREEVKNLLNKGAEKWTTTLLILTNGFSEFVDFNDYLDTVDQILGVEGAVGVIQAASFHPNYLFGGEDPESQSHYTNRSPYPLLHLIREEDIDYAKTTYPDIKEIPKNNIEKLKNFSKESLAKNLECLIKST